MYLFLKLIEKCFDFVCCIFRYLIYSFAKSRSKARLSFMYWNFMFLFTSGEKPLSADYHVLKHSCKSLGQKYFQKMFPLANEWRWSVWNDLMSKSQQTFMARLLGNHQLHLFIKIHWLLPLTSQTMLWVSSKNLLSIRKISISLMWSLW